MVRLRGNLALTRRPASESPVQGCASGPAKRLWPLLRGENQELNVLFQDVQTAKRVRKSPGSPTLSKHPQAPLMLVVDAPAIRWLIHKNLEELGRVVEMADGKAVDAESEDPDFRL